MDENLYIDALYTYYETIANLKHVLETAIGRHQQDLQTAAEIDLLDRIISQARGKWAPFTDLIEFYNSLPHAAAGHVGLNSNVGGTTSNSGSTSISSSGSSSSSRSRSKEPTPEINYYSDIFFFIGNKADLLKKPSDFEHAGIMLLE